MILNAVFYNQNYFRMYTTWISFCEELCNLQIYFVQMRRTKTGNCAINLTQIYLLGKSGYVHANALQYDFGLSDTYFVIAILSRDNLFLLFSPFLLETKWHTSTISTIKMWLKYDKHKQHLQNHKKQHLNITMGNSVMECPARHTQFLHNFPVWWLYKEEWSYVLLSHY